MTLREEMQRYALIHDVPVMQEEGQLFLLRLIREQKVRSILELGTAIAYTTLAMASQDPQIHIDTVERDPQMAALAEDYIRRSSHAAQITLYPMDIDDFVTEKKYDLILVDAAKAQYPVYFRRFQENLQEEGLFVFDDMVFHGMIERPEQPKNRSTRNLLRRIARFRREAASESGFTCEFYDKIGDGILIMRRRKKDES
ncbi:MAG: methyltransferase [Erysipelotrichaceae bacterium]|nr:methyltransferase [Erysipelotrichaceae bacterium]